MAVASANLEFLRTELGEHSELLQHLPTDQVIIQPQDHAPGAVPFMLHFGYIRDKWTTKRQSVWILLFLPARDGGSAEVKFVSYDEENKRYEWEDAANIISATTGCAAAFNLPKRLSRGKCVALVKYYFLHQLAGDERNKLDFNIPISKTFLGDLRTICRDMDETSKKVRVESQGIVNNGQDSDLSDPPSDLCSPRATQKNPEVGPVAQTTMPTTSTPPVARSAVSILYSCFKLSHTEEHRSLLDLTKTMYVPYCLFSKTRRSSTPKQVLSTKSCQR
jgi:hypothetical protein